MGDPEVFVDPDGLRDAGRELGVGLGEAEGLLSRDGGRLTVTGPAARWDSGPLLSEAAAAWRSYVTDLQRRLRAFGDGLVADADRFEATDDYSAAELAGIPGSHPAYGRARGY